MRTPLLRRSSALFLGGLLLAAVAPAQRDCSRTSFGLTPLVDLVGTYRGESGGLWGGDSNVPPPAHAAAGLQLAQQVQPLDAQGVPTAAGRIVLLSIGMSNTTQEFSRWKAISDADPRRNGSLTLVDGAQGGQDARVFANPQAPAWTEVERRLGLAGTTAAQVQVVWLKQATAAPATTAWPAHVTELEGLLEQVLHHLVARFPNLRIAYLSSRIYGGYSLRPERSEPLSYETGYSVRRLLLRQASGDPALRFDPAQGAVGAPWLAWGPYLWADGTTPRSDGLTWICDDFQLDGIHPSNAGRDKVAALLDAHFTTHPTTTPWYLGGGSTNASFGTYGEPCPGTHGPPGSRSRGLPQLGNAEYAVGVLRALADAPATVLVGFGRVDLPLGGGCSLYVDPATVLLGWQTRTNSQGAAILPLPIPADPALLGGVFFSQWAILDPGGALVLDRATALSLSAGQQHRIGT